MDSKSFILVTISLLIFISSIYSTESKEKSTKKMSFGFEDEDDGKYGSNLDNIDDEDEDDDDKDDSDEDFAFEEKELTKMDSNIKEKQLNRMDIDLCKNVYCKAHQRCVVKSREVAFCVNKKKKIVKNDLNHGPGKERKKSNQFKLNSINRNKLANCKQCPVTKPDFVCGDDNSTYSSICRLNFHNCVHQTQIKAICRGFCPCKRVKNFQEKQKESRTLQRWEKYFNKMKEEKLDKKMKTESRKANEIAKQFNSALPAHVDYISSSSKKHKQQLCTSEELKIMGTRLMDWFSVVVADQKRRRKSSHKKKLNFVKIPACKSEITWMFHHLDFDNDMRLSLKELFDLEHDEREKCLKPYLDSCDEDRDTFLNPYEWCTCFDQKVQSCSTAAKSIMKDLVGNYVPQCTSEGFYKPIQCHGGSGMCWCVDKNGVEFINTRRRGKPDCEGMLNRAKERQKNQDVDAEDDEDDLEGSGNDSINV